ncbi:hypothetical protein B0A52_05187 [Exophiala mesophila]|uniref:Uncharacterized protein n=1 Tax=Exophiala mesophila TaxID=212818 RepID=A0A438N449_EXOME|nr:hypothetical protein B0A52_05187 [Exophiala mesophila]
MSLRSIVLVTGGNNGIGYEIVKALLQSNRSYHVIMGSRSMQKADAAINSIRHECPALSNTVEPLQLELTSDESIHAACDHVQAKHGRIDTLVNNAGAAFDAQQKAGRVTLREAFTFAYDVNVAGTHVLSDAMMPLLLRSSDPRLIFVTGLSAINKAATSYFPTPPLPAGWPKSVDFETIAYRCSKVALNMLMLDWNHKLKQDNVKVWAVGPGMLATDLGGVGKEVAQAMGAGHPRAGGDIVRRVVEGERDADIGKIVIKDGGIMDW